MNVLMPCSLDRTTAGSALHLFYIAADGLLIIGLVTTLVVAVRRWVTVRPAAG